MCGFRAPPSPAAGWSAEEQEGEFLRFRYADFVDEELQPSLPSTLQFQSEQERTRFILDSVEEDRAAIVRETLRMISSQYLPLGER